MSPDHSERSLNTAERAALLRVLSADFPGASELRAQIDHAVVTRAWYAGAASVDIEVRAEVPRADLPNGPAPVEADVTDADGEPIGGILIWVGSGLLSAIEYYLYGDAVSTELPPPERIEVSPLTPAS